jgi:light-regulated signal transduction histidine kinase (bacteriophytochrome)
MVANVSSGATTWQQEYRVILPDGENRWINQFTVAQRDEDGRATHVDSYATDATVRIQAERQLLELNLELEERVRRRTAQLEAANDELESFAYSVSHDLRAPLQAIFGFSGGLLHDWHDKPPARAKESLGRILSAAERMTEMIDGIMELSKATRAELRVDRVDLSEVAHSVVEELRVSEPGRSVDVVIEPGIAAMGDPRLLRQVLQNLLGNAWKFTQGRDTARIEFVMDGADPGSDGVEPARQIYLIRDNGAGFDMRYAEKLFSPFRRLHSADDFEGTGIGLATVQRIVRRHGGRIWAQAEIGRGAAFFFSLPTADETN